MAATAQIASRRQSPMRDDGLKVNIGCGLSGIAGWYNLDNSPTILLARLPFGQKLFKVPAWPKDVRRYDVRKGLPFADESVSYVYSSHTFEHFSYAESLAVAKECFRVLRTGGIVRIVVPDLGLIVKEYLADPEPLASHRLLTRMALHRSLQDLIHPGSNHAQMFDGRSLTHLLREAGFQNPQVSSFKQSGIPEIELIELEERRRESLYVECQK